MNGGKNNLLLIGLVVAGCCCSVFGGKIVRPWRATTAIVKCGETFEVWMDADVGQNVTGVELRGPYNTVAASIMSQATDTWTYDQWSGNTCNRKLTVTVPENAPADRYDLVLKTSTGDVTSLAAVKVIKDFRSKFYIFHISDMHRWQGSYDTEGVILKEQTAMVEIANILNPAMVIETGDNHFPNSNVMTGTNVKSTESRANQFYNGDDTFLGLNDFFAPAFTIPGNHDTPNKGYENEAGYDSNDLDGPWLASPAQYWNDFYGLQNHSFAYGDARFVGVNNAWCPDTGGGDAGYVPNYQWQLDQANDWLVDVGAGTVQVTYQHVPQESIPPIYKALEYGPSSVIPEVMLAGHIHNTASNPFIKWDTKVYCTYSCRDGSKKVPFNLYQVDTVAGTVVPVGGTTAAQEGLTTRENYSTTKLQRSFSQANDGSQVANTATIVNNFGFPIEDARVRFVLAQGTSYSISQGSIVQAFDGDTVHVVDVRLDLTANSTTVINIGEMSASPNQSQFVSWDVPSQLDLGETITVNVTMKNSGLAAWTTAAGQQLGTTASIWSTNRVALPASPVATNQNAVFSFSITAPNTPGSYNFQWQMIDEAGDNTGWFGPQTPLASVQVGDTSPVVNFIDPDGDVTLDVGADLYVNVGATDPNGGTIRVRLYLDGAELARSEGLAPYTWNGSGQSDPELLNMQQGTYVLKAKATDDQNESTEISITITVGDDTEPPVTPAGEVILAVDFHQTATDPVPETPDYFTGWFVGNVSAGVAAPSTTIEGYTLTVGSGTSVDCLVTPASQTGMNARNRSLGYILNAGDFTQADMMRERIASLVNPTAPATGKGTGNGLYLKVAGLETNTSYLVQVWGVDSKGTFADTNARLKDGYNYGFNATAEGAGYTSLPQLGAYTVSGSPTAIADNDEYSVSGIITTDSSGTLIYKQISNIDKSVLNGFVLSTVEVAPLEGYDAWAATNGVGAAADDDDNDGQSNLFDYALNGNPGTGVPAVQPVLRVVDGEPLYCHLRRNDDALMYEVMFRTNLVAGGWTTNGVVTIGPVDSGQEFDEVTNTVSTMSEQVFIRLNIIQP